MQGVAGLGAAVVGEDLDGAPVVQAEHLGHQVAHRVFAQVGGQVADAQRSRALGRPE